MDLVRGVEAKLAGLDLRPIKTRLLIGPDTLSRLGEAVAAVAGEGPVVIFTDATPMRRGSVDLKEAVLRMLHRHAPDQVILGAPGVALKADEETFKKAESAAAGKTCIITVGSGTITDVGKVVSAATGVPLVAVQTAASVNGYADDLAVVLRAGAKRTIPAVWPAALIIDDAVISSAPIEFNRAGVGEMMSMFTAPVDWLLAAAVGMDPGFYPEVVDLYRSHGTRFLSITRGVAEADAGALRMLTDLLTLSGLAMGVCGRTAPMSGAEHAISHLLDMSGNGHSGLHGAQVGVAAVIVACVWEDMLDGFDPQQIRPANAPDDEAALAEINAAFGFLGKSTVEECWIEYTRKLGAWRVGLEGVKSGLEHLPDRVGGLLGDPRRMVAALRACGAAARFSELDPPVGADRARWAIATSHLMRARFSVFDLCRFSGRDVNGLVESALARAGALGGGL
jgi:glycerol-1-phosphate dehydrogenase [NAD(P)+]